MATAKKQKTPKKTKAIKGKDERGSKARFVRGMPAEMPAKQVVEEAAKQGIKLSENHVYAVRSEAKKTKKGATKADPKKSSATSAGRKKRKTVAPTRTATKPGSLEAQLRHAIGELGLARAREVFAEVERAFAGG